MVVIKSLHANSKEVKWNAHDGTVLKMDWSPVNKLILTGGEDCHYKVGGDGVPQVATQQADVTLLQLWDSFGRLLYSSCVGEFPVTAVSWAPSGDVFSVGSFNTLLLCDRHGVSCEATPGACVLTSLRL